MTSQLKKLYPVIREREEILAEIEKKPLLSREFHKWGKGDQLRFLDMCTGVRGARILYDPFFKEIMNPEYTPERMESFLSAILKQNVKILQVLPNDSVRITSEGTLLITDIVVELEDGSIVNVEVQRIGYKFPGQRAACYSADMLLRQYKRVREQRGKKFIYQDVKPVYTIVLFERSPFEFRCFEDEYIHYVEARSDTGIKIDLLQKYVFVALDNFKERSHNTNIANEMEAWLTFFSSENPVQIAKLIEEYPQFRAMYANVYNICQDTKRVMEMFSKELQIIDENTVQYMMDELQAKVDELQDKVGELQDKVDTSRRQLDEQDKTLGEQEKALEERNKALEERNKALGEKDKALGEKDKALNEKEQAIAEQQQLIAKLQKELEEACK